MSDADYASVSLLLLANGTNGSTTFTDSGPLGNTVTAVGNAQISTSSPKYGSGSLLLDGTGDYLTVPHTGTNWCRFPGVFTWDWWFKHTSTARGAFFGCGETPRSSTNYVVEVNSIASNTLYIFTGAGSDTLLSFGDSSFSDGNWHHMAITRDGSNDLRVYYDGVYKTGVNTSFSFDTGTGGVWVGNWIIIPTLSDYAGNIDCFRMTKGVARWTGTGSFTPPTTEDDYLPAVAAAARQAMHYKRLRAA